MVAITTQRRLAALEGPGDECPYCGDGGDDDETYEVVFMEDDEDETPDEYCPSCGRVISLTITFGDEV